MSPNDINDSDLSAVLEDLVHSYGRKWLSFAQSMVQNQADAEDVLQESMLKMLARGRHFQSPDQARMYLGRIISNTAIERYHTRRRIRRQQRPLHDHLFKVPAASEPAPCLSEEEELQTRARVLGLLHEGLSRLPVKQYEALRMTVMDPSIVSMRDAGVEHDIPYSTLRHRKLQGLRRLKRFIHRALRATQAKLLMA